MAAGRCVPELGKACDAICTTAEAEMAAAGADAKAAAAVVPPGAPAKPPDRRSPIQVMPVDIDCSMLLTHFRNICLAAA